MDTREHSQEEIEAVCQQVFKEVADAFQDDRVTGAVVHIRSTSGHATYQIKMGDLYTGQTDRLRRYADNNTDWLARNQSALSSAENTEFGERDQRPAGAVRASSWIISSACFKKRPSETLSLLLGERLGWLSHENAVAAARESCNFLYFSAFAKQDGENLELCKSCHSRLVAKGETCSCKSN